MNKTPFVSIIIPTLNREKRLCQTIDAILKQNYPAFEIIVVDQIPRHQKKTIDFFHKAKIRYFPVDFVGTTKARNFGLNKAKGEIIIFLDDDISPNSTFFIKQHIQNYQDHSVDGIGGRVLISGEASKDSNELPGHVTKTGHITANFAYKKRIETEAPIGCNMSFRKKAIEDVGIFDPNFLGGMKEETDFTLRFIRKGHRVIFDPKAVIIHYTGGKGGTRAGGREDFYYRFFFNEILFFLKHFKKVYFPFFVARRARPTFACMFYYGKFRPKALFTPFRAFWNGYKAYKKELKEGYQPSYLWENPRQTIGIDVREMVGKRAGKGEFVYQFIHHLAKIENYHKIILFSKKDFKINAQENFQKVIFRAPSLFWHLRVWLNLLSNKIDLYFAPTSYLITTIFKKSIIVVHDLAIFKLKKGQHPLADILERLTLGKAAKNAKLIIAMSQNTKKDLVEIFGIDESKIKVVYQAAGDHYQEPLDARLVQKVLDRYKIKKEFILFVGTLEPRKNIIGVLRAYKLLPRDLKEKYDLVIAGKKGWNFEEIFATAKNLQIENKVHFLDYVRANELPYLYKSAVLFVYPSIYEGFGIPPLEAMSVGTPVVTSNTSSLPEVVGDAGELVDPYNFAEISRAMEKILRNPILSERLSKKGLLQSRQFSWHKSALFIWKLILNETKN